MNEGAGILAGEIVGAVLPSCNNMRLSYKQKRLERNVANAIKVIVKRQDEMDNLLLEIRQKNSVYWKTITEAMLDNIVEEIQDKMVVYNVNGYVNLLKTDNKNLDINMYPIVKTINKKTLI